jgi:hypothetical protein
VTALLVGVAALVWPLAGSAGGAALSPPSRLGDYVRFQDARSNKSGSGLKLAKRQQVWDRRTAAVLSRAYGGAAAAAQRYTNQGLDNFFLLLAVRASSPRLFAPYEDAEYLGLARPSSEVLTRGAVDCLVQNEPTARGGSPPPTSVHVVTCQRSDKHLTVQITRVSGDLGNATAAVSNLVEQAWRELT